MEELAIQHQDHANNSFLHKPIYDSYIYIQLDQNTCAFVRAFKAKKTQELIPTNGEQPVRCHYYQQNDLGNQWNQPNGEV